MMLEGRNLVPHQQLDRWPVGNFSKEAALQVGLSKATVASNANEQLQRQVHVLRRQLGIERTLQKLVLPYHVQSTLVCNLSRSMSLFNPS